MSHPLHVVERAGVRLLPLSTPPRYPPYSALNAMIGSTLAARRAGM